MRRQWRVKKNVTSLENNHEAIFFSRILERVLFVDINFKNLFREDTFVNWSQNGSQDIFSREPTLAHNNRFVLTGKEFHIPKRLSN